MRRTSEAGGRANRSSKTPEDAGPAEIHFSLESYMHSLRWRYVATATLLVTFAVSKPIATSACWTQEAGQEKKPAKVDVEKIIEAWTFPGANALKEWHNIYPHAKQLSPYITSRKTDKPFKEVWQFYAKKCGSDAEYEKHGGGGGQDQDGFHSILGRWGEDGAERACFVRVVTGYAVTVLITKKKDGGTEMEIICIVR